MFKLILVLSVAGFFSACSPNGVTATNLGGDQRGLATPAPINGLCGKTKYVCDSGGFATAADTATQHQWSCSGANGGRNDSCSSEKRPPSSNAACGLENNSCISGTTEDVADSTTQFLWKCSGVNEGAVASCSLDFPPPPPEPIDENCVQVFYDSTVDALKLGRNYALMTLNLLGHFPEYQQVVGPIELYRKGDIARCRATFYIGMEYDKQLPPAFLEDFKTATKQVVWMGYNFWQLGAAFEQDFGYSATDYEMTTLDYTNLTPAPDSKPGFFRDILYKGEVFPKYNVWDPANPTVMEAPFEMAKLKTKLSDVAVVLGQARHSVTGEIIPWALQSKNKFFITEIPISFAHEADRYFVFADLLFDFLNTQPKHNEKNAFIRLEDIGAFSELELLEEGMAILRKYQIPPHINLYPIFGDPLFSITGHEEKPFVRMEDVPVFTDLVTKYKNEGTVFIWHGVTHQYNSLKNPWTAASGDDYEFWNYPADTPIAEDSVSYVLDKMDDGFTSLKKYGIAPKVWVTPHYHASALDTVIFGQIFPWVAGRVVYSDARISGLKSSDDTKPRYFDLNDASTAQNRRDHLSGLQVTTDSAIKQFGQMFPYELYGDIYGQRVLPENLGNVEPYLSDQVQFIRTVDVMLEDAKRNLVLRDVWASCFYHPFLLDPTINSANQDITKPKDLERLVSGIQALGYKYINLETYVEAHKAPAGKPRIELEEIRK